jgi:quercetin dioxygenase-like cupin family protein
VKDEDRRDRRHGCLAARSAANSRQKPQGSVGRVRPGGYPPSHTHAKSALIYATVIEGEVRSKVNDGPEKTYRTGENRTEMPGERHVVSANASATKPAKILAVFFVDDQDTVLTIPDQK